MGEREFGLEWETGAEHGRASAEAAVGIPVDGVDGPTQVRLPAPTDRSVVELLEAAKAMGPNPDLAGVDDERIEVEVRTLAAQLAAMTCRWLEFVAELVVRDIWARQGARTPAAWLSWAVGMGASTAREHVRVALRLRELSRIRETFAAGEISYSKVRALTRVATPELEEVLLDWAACAPASELEEVIAACAASDRRRHTVAAQTRRLTSRIDGAEMVITVRVPVEQGEAAMARIDRQVDALPRPDELRTEIDDDPALPTPDVPLAARRADAVIELLTGRTPASSAGTSEPLLMLHVAPEDLTEAGTASAEASRRTAPATLNARSVPAMSVATLRRLACDVSVAVLVEAEDGTPLDLGRRQRKLSMRLRRALVARDRGCRFPGCGITHGLHAHHIVHWADDGPTDLDNLVLLCGYHHRWVHEHGWTIRLDGPRVHLLDPAGTPLPSAIVTRPASAEALRTHLTDARQRLDRGLQADWDGRHDTDIDTAIDFVTRELDRYRQPMAA